MPNQVIKNPWEDLLLELVKKSKSSIRITSPFIKASSTKKLLKAKKDSAKLSLISSFKLMSFHLKVSDFAAIESIIRTSGVVKNNHYLHAKKYIFDNSKVVVTSANLTESGLKRNYEYGVLIDEKRLVKKIVEDYERLFHHKDTGDIDLEKISVAKSILMKIPKTKRLTLPKIDNISESEEISVYTGGIETIRNTLSGWR